MIHKLLLLLDARKQLIGLGNMVAQVLYDDNE